MEAVNYKFSLTRRKEVIIHLVFWLLLAYFSFFQIDRNSPFYFSFKPSDIFTVSWSLVFVISFYFHYWLVMPRIFKNFEWKKVAIGFLVAVLFFVGLRFLVEEVLLELLFGRSNYFKETSGWYYFYDNLYYSTFPIIPGTLIWLIIFLVRLLEYNNFVLEEKKNTEVKFLKAQLNPHFMFNTLNNIYSLVYFNSEKALPAIEKLSNIMRFTTYESQKERINLQEEIDYIRSLIDLEQLRQDKEFLVDMKLDLENPQQQIPPLLLTPLVENALKHSPAATKKETQVEIVLEQRESGLKLVVTNEIGDQNKDKTGGIGLENLKRRLLLHYPEKHNLLLTRLEPKFIAELTIQY